MGLLRYLVDLVDRHPRLFLALWIAGLVALAPLCLLPETTPPTKIADVELGLDKLFHFIAYGGLAALAMLLFHDRYSRRWSAAIVLTAALGYEIGQLWVPNRSFGLDDLAANTLGFLLGLAVGLWLRRRPVAALA